MSALWRHYRNVWGIPKVSRMGYIICTKFCTNPADISQGKWTLQLLAALHGESAVRQTQWDSPVWMSAPKIEIFQSGVVDWNIDRLTLPVLVLLAGLKLLQRRCVVLILCEWCVLKRNYSILGFNRFAGIHEDFPNKGRRYMPRFKKNIVVSWFLKRYWLL